MTEAAELSMPLSRPIDVVTDDNIDKGGSNLLNTLLVCVIIVVLGAAGYKFLSSDAAFNDDDNKPEAQGEEHTEHTNTAHPSHDILPGVTFAGDHGKHESAEISKKMFKCRNQYKGHIGGTCATNLNDQVVFECNDKRFGLNCSGTCQTQSQANPMVYTRGTDSAGPNPATCKPVECLHNGEKSGNVCVCQPGFVGDRCQFESSKCQQEDAAAVMQVDGTCVCSDEIYKGPFCTKQEETKQ